MRVLQEKFRSESIEISADMLDIFALVDQNLAFERQVTRRKQTLAEKERKLKVASSAAFSAQRSALAKTD